MPRFYRRPGIARPVDDMYSLRAEGRRATRLSPAARRERISRLIGQLIARHDEQDVADKPDDRRSALRQPADERPYRAQGEDTDPQRIWLEDVSRSGMRFRSSYAYPVGALVTVEPPKSVDLPPIRLRILRSHLLTSGAADQMIEYGAEYAAQSSESHAWYIETRTRYCG